MTARLALLTWKVLKSRGVAELDPWLPVEHGDCLNCNGRDCVEGAPCADAAGREGEIFRCTVCDAVMPVGDLGYLDESAGNA